MASPQYFPGQAGVAVAEAPPAPPPDPMCRPWSWGRFIAIASLLFVIGGAWTFVMPPAAQPDESDHVIRAWAVWDGQFVGEQLPDGTSLQVVPEAMPQTGRVGCFAFHPEIDASCAYPLPATEQLVDVNARAGRYNPVFYFFSGWAFHVFDDPANALYVARLITGFIASLLTALGICAALMYRSAVVTAAATVVGLTPTVLSLFGSLNPSAWEISGTVAGVTGMFLLVLRPQAAAARSWAIIAGIGLSVMVITRAASYLWLAVFLAFALLVGIRRLRQIFAVRAVWWSALAIVLATGWSVIWQRIAGTGAFALDTQGRGYREGVRVVFKESGFWWDRMIGWLGWTDVAPTTLTVWVMVMCFGVILLGGLAAGRAWHATVLVLMVIAAVVVPLAGAVYLYPALGNIWQGRYNIPICLLPLLFAAMLWDLEGGTPVRLRQRLQVFLVIAWAAASIAMVYNALQRFAVGIPATRTEYGFFLRDNPWEPPGRVLTWLVVGSAGYLALGLALVLLSRSGVRGLPADVGQDETGTLPPPGTTPADGAAGSAGASPAGPAGPGTGSEPAAVGRA